MVGVRFAKYPAGKRLVGKVLLRRERLEGSIRQESKSEPCERGGEVNLGTNGLRK